MILSSVRTSPFGPRAKLLHAGRFPGPTKVAALRYDKPAALPDDAYLVFSIVGEPSRTALKGYPQPCRNLLREILFRRLHGISTSWPRRRRDAPPRSIRVAVARLHGMSASRPRRRRDSDYPRRGRGGAATRLHGMSTRRTYASSVKPTSSLRAVASKSPGLNSATWHSPPFVR